MPNLSFYRISPLLIATTVCLLATAHADAQATDLNFNKGDHIAIVGNTTAERIQHDGWLETMLQSRMPEKELVVRNLGFSADQLSLRLRVEGFGSEDHWLTKVEADVIFAFFGFNESFAGAAGLEKFERNLASRIAHWKGQKYNGDSAPTIVLFSPIAQEDLGDPNLPDANQNNANIKMYTDAMAKVAQAGDVHFVNVYTPMHEAMAKDRKLTINGVHLNTPGNRALAVTIDKALVPGEKAKRNRAQMRKLRQAVTDKNFYWFHRYQTTDGYNVHGQRSHLDYNGITNRVVMDREMEILEIMTANRDVRVHSVAQGGDAQVNDGNLPEQIPVKTNAPGQGPDGTHLFQPGEEQVKTIETPEGFEVSLFASEEQFPELINPVQMAFDTQGRLFVATWETYPHWKPGNQMNDKLLILKDNDNDGKADEAKVFAEGLHNPTGFEFWGGGVFVANQPELLFLKDTDGDDVADVRIRVLHGLSSGDTHHAANSFVLDPGGALYFQEGVFHRSQIETPRGPLYSQDGVVWRFEPRTWKVNRHATHNGLVNPHGHVYDRWGQGIIHDGTTSRPYHETVVSGHTIFPQRHAGNFPLIYNRRTRPCPATEMLSSPHFPDNLQGNMLVLNVIGDQAILQYELSDDGSTFSGKEIEKLVRSPERNFRPVDAEFAPDGSLYFTDWANPVIGHMQHHIRDPSRDHEHGRVFRVTYPGRPLAKPKKIAGASIPALLDVLKSDFDRERYRARIELSDRETGDVIEAVKQWTKSLDENDANYEHHMLEALWVHQQHNTVNLPLLKRMLRSSDFNARAAATRVLCYQRDRVPDALALLEVQVTDEHPRVRLEGVRAASFFVDQTEKAIEVALLSLDKDQDAALKYVMDQTMNTLERAAKMKK